MNDLRCQASEDDLLGWWLGELSAAEADAVERHLFGCGDCAARLERLLGLGEAIGETVARGQLGFIASTRLVARLKESGLTVREYALGPGESVHCTIAPGDDFVVARLSAPLADVSRLDVLVEDPVAGQVRLTDVAFDREAGMLTLVPSAALLRTLTHEQQRVRLLAVGEAGEREIAEYTFNHYPTRV